MARRQRFGTILEKKPSEIGEVKRYLIHSKENYVQNNFDICKIELFRLSSFQGRDTKLERFLATNQYS